MLASSKKAMTQVRRIRFHSLALVWTNFIPPDLVIWDSHPLALGATPKQVFIDGIAQLASPNVVNKPATFQKTPKTPNFDKEAANAVEYEGLPPLEPEQTVQGTVVFTNVKSVTQRVSGTQGAELIETFRAESSASDSQQLGVVVVDQGRIACAGLTESCAKYLHGPSEKVVDLNGGSIAPSLVSYGSALGLEEINGEVSTQDGVVYDALSEVVPSILGGDKATALIRAVDGLQFATRDA